MSGGALKSLGTRVRSAWLATNREPRLRGGYASLRLTPARASASRTRASRSGDTR